jgi:hypothetical protein
MSTVRPILLIDVEGTYHWVNPEHVQTISETYYSDWDSEPEKVVKVGMANSNIYLNFSLSRALYEVWGIDK